MNLKEHVQFLIMMIPTFLLLVVAAVTLAFPARSMGEPASIVQSQAEGGERGARDIEIGTVVTAPDR